MAGGYQVNQHFLTDNKDAYGISTNRPKHPEYALRSKRAESFKTWPEYLPIKSDVLIDAGLVYTGVGDSVRCYNCGGGLRNWEPEDDPWKEHAHFYPTCPYVILMKGQDYIDCVNRGETPNDIEAQEERKPKEELMKRVAAQSCLQNGYSEKSVKRAVKFFQQNQGHTDFTGADLCQIILDQEDFDDSDNTTSSNEDITVEETTSREKEDDIDTLLSENRRLKDNKMCKICLDGVANIIFLPCGHMVSCPQCATALSDCPICRVPVEGFVKAYYCLTEDKQTTE